MLEWYQVFKMLAISHRQVCGIVQILLCSCCRGLLTWACHWVFKKKNPCRLLLRMRGKPWWGSLFTHSWWICAVLSSTGLIFMTRLSAPSAGKAGPWWTLSACPSAVVTFVRDSPGDVFGMMGWWWLTTEELLLGMNIWRPRKRLLYTALGAQGSG